MNLLFSLLLTVTISAGMSDRAGDVLARMSLEQKARLVVGYPPVYANVPPGTAGITYGIDSLDIPPIGLADGPMGLRLKPVDHAFTAYPIGPCLSSTWNMELVGRVGQSIGREASQAGIGVVLAPGINMMRNPLCGRNFEYYSEDPVLCGELASAYVNGMQGEGVGACVKHFAANNQETMRIIGDSRVSERALREIYLRPFEICVKKASPWTIMSSYNRLNGPWTQENRVLLTDILRGEWGYDGVVMTDWTSRRHTAAQIYAGNDLLEPGEDIQVQDIIDAVKDGTLAEEDLDTAVRRVLELVFKVADSKPGTSPIDASEVSLEAAREGLVLLKNEGNVLPLSAPQSVALLGVGSYDTRGTGHGAANVECAHVVTIAEGLESHGFDMDKESRELYGRYVDFASVDQRLNHWKHVHVGEPLHDELPLSDSFIENLASRCDIAVFTLSRMSGEQKDRVLKDDFYISELERHMVSELSEAFHSRGKKLIVVLNVCGPVETASWEGLTDGILCAWLPGQAAGQAIADVVSGIVNPSGRLPMSWPVDYFDIAGAEDFPYDYEGPRSNNASLTPDASRPQVRNVDYTDYSEGIYVGYRHFVSSGKPVSFPFGYGLSYTSFSYSDASAVLKGDKVRLKVRVTNIGDRPGKEAVGVYVHAPESGLDKPERELKAFGKTRMLSPGESQLISFEIPLRDLASFNEFEWEAAAGRYEFFFGADVSRPESSAAVRLKKTLTWPR